MINKTKGRGTVLNPANRFEKIEFEADPELKDMPIVFLTAAIQRSTVAAHDGIICDHPCIAKPASVDEIMEMIEKHATRPA